MLGFHVWSARRLGFHPLSDLRLRRLVPTAVVGGAPVLLIAPRIGSDLLAFAVIPPLGAFLFFTLALAFGALDREELADIVDSMPAPVRNAVESLRNALPETITPSLPPGQ